MDANRRLAGGAVVVVVLMTGAWMMGRKSATGAVGTPGSFAPANVPGGGLQQGMNPGASAPAMAAAPYGANPGAEMSAPGAQTGPSQYAPQSAAQPSAMPQPDMPQSGEMGQPQAYGNSMAGGGNQYQDPGGQFSIQVPSGWQSTPQNGGVIISRGSSMVVVSPFNGAQSGEQIVSTLARQYGSQWSNLQVSDQGQFSIGGAPAAYMMMNGRSPRGVQSLLRLAGAVRGNQGFAIIISTPLSEFNSTSPQLQSIESSLAFGPGGE